MPARVALALTIATDMAQAFADPLDGGALVLYMDGTAAPATPEDPVPDDAVECVRFDLPGVGAAVVVYGVATVAALPPEAAQFTGRIGWARVERADGSGIMLPNVGAGDEALVLTSLEVVEGEPVTVAAWSFVVPTLMEE